MSNSAEINQFLSAGAKKEVTDYIASLEKIVISYKDIATASLQVEKAKQAEQKTEQELLKTQQQAEILAQKKIKTQQDEIKATEKLATATKKEADAINKNNSEWQKLNKAHSEALQKARDLGVQYGKNSTQFKNAAKEANALNTKMQGLNKELGGSNPKGVGKYFEAIMKGAGALGLVTGGAALAVKAFEGLKNGSQTFGDAFARTMGAVNGATSVFFSMLGTGNMDNFIQRLKDGAKAGRELADALDDMMEFGLSVDILEANTNKLISEQEVIRNSVLKTTTERIAAAEEINRLESELEEAKASEAKRIFGIYAKNIEDGKKVDREKLIAFITNYRVEEDLRKSMLKKIEDAAIAEKNIFGTTAESRTSQRDAIRQNLEKNLTEEEKIYREFYQVYGELTDDEINNTIKAYAQITNVETEGRDRKLRNETKLAKFKKELQDDGSELDKKAWEKEKKILEDNAKWTNELSKNQREQEKVTQDKQMEEREKRDKIREDKQEDFIKNSKRIQDELTAGEEKGEKERLEKEKWAADESKKIEADRAKYIEDMLRSAAAGAVDLVNERYDSELASMDAYYSSRIEAESNAGHSTTKLELEYETKKAELEKKKFRFNQAAKIAEIAANTIMKVAEIQSIANVYYAGALTAPLGVIAEAQIPWVIGAGALATGMILAQKPPKFAKGSDYTPDTFWAGEEGMEMVTDKKGRSFFTPDKATLYTGMEGSKVLPNKETLELLAYEKAKGENLLPTLEEIRKELRNNKPVINIINRYNQRFDERYQSMRQ